MAGLGFFAGGIAKGLESGERTRLGREELAVRTQQIAADRELRNTALGIDQKREERLQQNSEVTQANELIAKEMEIIAQTVEAAKLQNAAPEKIAKSVLPLLQDVQRLAGITGADPNAYASQVDALVTAPTAAEAAAAKGAGEATAKVAERDALKSAGVPAQQADVAAGLAQRMSLFDQMILGNGGGAGAQTGALPFEADQAKRALGKVYALPDGRQALWTRDATGKVGWELLN